jgi:hypothetical protein
VGETNGTPLSNKFFVVMTTAFCPHFFFHMEKETVADP